MERKTKIAEAKQVFGKYFIGPDELSRIADKMAIIVPKIIPDIDFTLSELSSKQKDYILILGVSQMYTGESLTLNSLRNHFGTNPDTSEPCFYNQDWYLKERFMARSLDSTWFLIRKDVFPESKGVNPENFISLYSFPSAVLCAYSFFANWFNSGELLWKHDFVWCEDLDHNGDRIYIGKYLDIEGINKNGFSIHRHLRIRNFYGAIDMI